MIGGTVMIDFKWAWDNPQLWTCNPQEKWDRHPNQECSSLHYGVAWPADDSATWPEWTDALGTITRPGDLVSIATVSGRSPAMVVGEVQRFNRKNSRGELHRGRQAWLTPDGKLPAGFNRWDKNPNRPPEVVVPGCTVTARPVYSRFTRYGAGGFQTYQFIQNIVRLDDHTASRIMAQQPETPDIV